MKPLWTYSTKTTSSRRYATFWVMCLRKENLCSIIPCGKVRKLSGQLFYSWSCQEANYHTSVLSSDYHSATEGTHLIWHPRDFWRNVTLRMLGVKQEHFPSWLKQNRATSAALLKLPSLESHVYTSYAVTCVATETGKKVMKLQGSLQWKQ